MKILKLAYSLLAYVFFLGVFNYLVLFLGANFLADWLPILASLKTIDTGEAYFEISFLPVWLGNVVLLVAFSLHHSVFARLGIKRVLTRFIPQSAERSTFVLLTCCILAWMYLAWQPQTAIVWQVEGSMMIGLALLFLMGAGLVLWSTFMISHWRLFGLEQAWNDFKGHAPAEDRFARPALYKYSRHPMYVGILVVLWSTPYMTVGHLLLAVVWSVYVFIGIYFEERDLVRHFGQRYRDYQASVSKLIPFRAIGKSIRRQESRLAQSSSVEGH